MDAIAKEHFKEAVYGAIQEGVLSAALANTNSDTEAEQEKDDAPKYYRLGDNGEKIPITRAEYKEHQRKFVTRHYQLLPICDHKLVPGREPRHRNCESCWFAFYQTHGGVTQTAEKLFQEHGESGLVQLKGKKFTQMFLAFMSTIAQWRASIESQKTNAN